MAALTAEIIEDTGMAEDAARHMAEHIVAETEKAPPLTAWQSARLALLLQRPAPDDGEAAARLHAIRAEYARIHAEQRDAIYGGEAQ